MSRKRQRTITDRRQPAAVSMELALNNDDLLMQILLLLPAKSLIRLKFVCKRWLSLISSNYFCHQHTLHCLKLQQSLIIQMRSLQLFYLNQTTSGKNVMIPYSLSVLDPHQVVQECHGLLLLESKHRLNSFYVYNPTTRRLRKIIMTKNDEFPCVVSITLAFDPSKSPYYKVVCFRSTTAERDTLLYACQIEVYDSESHTWKISLKESKCWYKIYGGGLHWNNYIYWQIGVCFFMYFDIAKNKVRCVYHARAPYDLRDNINSFLAESNGHLYYFVIPESGEHGSGVVWEVAVAGGRPSLHKCLGHLHFHSKMDINAVDLMVRSGGDGSTCSLLVYEAKRRRIMAYSYLDDSSELLVNLRGQPVSKSDQVMDAFVFGETLALV